jgi:hypothetical protein
VGQDDFYAICSINSAFSENISPKNRPLDNFEHIRDIDFCLWLSLNGDAHKSLLPVPQKVLPQQD